MMIIIQVAIITGSGDLKSIKFCQKGLIRLEIVFINSVIRGMGFIGSIFIDLKYLVVQVIQEG